MRVFELFFNPKAKETAIYDSFVYEPENIYERRLGNLYMAGELTNVLPQNSRFLYNLATVVKKEYYLKLQAAFEQSFRDGLKIGNEFLEGEVKKGNVSWLGNLNFAILSFKDLILNFTKVGNTKILLLRPEGGSDFPARAAVEIIDIGAELESRNLQSLPSKVFGSIVTGKLSPDDKIMLLTRDAFELLKKNDLIKELALTADEKELKRLLKEKRKILSETSGVCLFIYSLPKSCQKEKSIKEYFEAAAFKKKKVSSRFIIQGLTYFGRFLNKISKIFAKIFGLPSRILYLRPHRKMNLDFLKKRPSIIAGLRQGFLKKLSLPPHPKSPAFQSGDEGREKDKFLRKGLLKIAAFRANFISKINRPFHLPAVFPSKIKKLVILILILVLVLLIGFLIFREKKEQKLEAIMENLEEVQAKVVQAQNALIFKDEARASLLFREAWQEILPFLKEESPFQKEAQELKESIEEGLTPLCKMERIENPELVFEIKKEEIDFVPQKMLVLENNFYFFTPYFKNLFFADISQIGEIKNLKSGATKTLSLAETSEQILNLAVPLEDDSVLFFSLPDKLTILKNGEVKKTLVLKSFPSDIQPAALGSFNSNLYFLDGRSGEIIKYPYLGNSDWGEPGFWLKKDGSALEQIEPGGKSITVDGSIWVLDAENKINFYRNGLLQKTLKPDVFPGLEKPLKIWTSPQSSYLYLLEPVQNRLVIFTKDGEIVKQYQSEKFDEILDFSVSNNEKTIYILNGLEVYKIK